MSTALCASIFSFSNRMGSARSGVSCSRCTVRLSPNSHKSNPWSHGHPKAQEPNRPLFAIESVPVNRLSSVFRRSKDIMSLFEQLSAALFKQAGAGRSISRHRLRPGRNEWSSQVCSGTQGQPYPQVNTQPQAGTRGYIWMYLPAWRRRMKTCATVALRLMRIS
jgi:hypothetical protein